MFVEFCKSAACAAPDIFTNVWFNFAGFLQSSQPSETHPRGCENPVANQPANCRVTSHFIVLLCPPLRLTEKKSKSVFRSGSALFVKFLVFVLNLSGGKDEQRKKNHAGLVSHCQGCDSWVLSV